VHCRTTSNVLYALVRCKQKRFQHLNIR